MIKALTRRIDSLTKASAAVSDWMCFAVMALTAEQVIARYFFDSSSVALQELQWHLFGLVILLAMAQTLKTDQHVRVDIIYSKLSPKYRALIDLLGIALLLIPVCSLMVYYGWNYADQSISYTNINSLDHYSKAYFDPDGVSYRVFSTIESLFRDTILRGETSPNPGGLEGRWLIKAAIPLGFALLLLQSLSEACKRIRVLLGEGKNIER